MDFDDCALCNKDTNIRDRYIYWGPGLLTPLRLYFCEECFLKNIKIKLMQFKIFEWHNEVTDEICNCCNDEIPSDTFHSFSIINKDDIRKWYNFCDKCYCEHFADKLILSKL